MNEIEKQKLIKEGYDKAIEKLKKELDKSKYDKKQDEADGFKYDNFDRGYDSCIEDLKGAFGLDE